MRGQTGGTRETSDDRPVERTPRRRRSALAAASLVATVALLGGAPQAAVAAGPSAPHGPSASHGGFAPFGAGTALHGSVATATDANCDGPGGNARSAYRLLVGECSPTEANSGSVGAADGSVGANGRSTAAAEAPTDAPDDSNEATADGSATATDDAADRDASTDATTAAGSTASGERTTDGGADEGDGGNETDQNATDRNGDQNATNDADGNATNDADGNATNDTDEDAADDEETSDADEVTVELPSCTEAAVSAPGEFEYELELVAVDPVTGERFEDSRPTAGDQSLTGYSPVHDVLPIERVAAYVPGEGTVASAENPERCYEAGSGLSDPPEDVEISVADDRTSVTVSVTPEAYAYRFWVTTVDPETGEEHRQLWGLTEGRIEPAATGTVTAETDAPITRVEVVNSTFGDEIGAETVDADQEN